MLKNIARIIIVIVSCTAIMFSPYVCAETITTTTRIELYPTSPFYDRDTTKAAENLYPAEVGVQYTFTSKGLRKNGKHDIKDIDGVYKFYGVSGISLDVKVSVSARCISSNTWHNWKNISLTDSSLPCKKNEGIEFSMHEPGTGYHFVGLLKKSTEKKSIFSIGFDKIKLDEKLVNLNFISQSSML